ncbi:sensor histidine kinase [Pseudomonas borbori]
MGGSLWRALRQVKPVRRNLLLLFLPWAVLILLLAALLYERLLESRLNPLLSDQQNSLNVGVGVLNRHLATLHGNLQFLTQQPLLAKMLDEPSPENREALSQLLLQFSASTKIYDQIRWLDENGMEQISVELVQGKALLRDSAKLQNRADRYYFVEAMNQPAGTFYLSRFDLNRESAAGQPLMRPTLRGAMPVFDSQGARRGVLILNYLGQDLLRRLQQVSEANGGSLSLVDHEGYWMLSPEPEDEWGFMLGKAEATLASRYPYSWQYMQTHRGGVFNDENGYWAYSRFDPKELNGGRKIVAEPWLLISQLPVGRVESLRFEVFWQVMLFVSAMLGVGLVVVLRLALAEHDRNLARNSLQASSEALTLSNGELRETVDQLQRTRGALIQAEKLSSLGTLVAGVAHELNTPIGAASVTASTLHKNVVDMQASMSSGLQRSTLERFLQRNDEGLAIITSNLTRMAQLTRAFKQLASDRASTERRNFDLVELVREVMLVFTPKLKQFSHQVVLEMPEHLMLDSYPGPLGQILQNLIDNALIHAFEPGMQGVVTVRADHEPLSRQCLIDVIDNGCGMTPEVLAQIFDPFFTTRRGRGGTGLGLHITHQLAVEILGAELQVRSTPGQGTQFRLRLALA